MLDTPLGGYTHWMAFTPYPDDYHENPSIIGSNDGITWVVPAGLTNPIDPIPGDPEMVNGSRFNADTELVHVNGTLYAFWRFYDSSAPISYTVRMRTSTDGVTWTPREVVIESATDPFTSPFILYDEDLATWSMWYAGAQGADGRRPLRRRTAPSPTGPWSEPTDCTVLGLEDWRHLWHFDAIRHDGLYIGLLSSTAKGTTNIAGVMYLAVSRDGDTWAMGPAVVGPTRPAPGVPSKWDSNIIYRCSGVVEGDVIRVWYSAMPKIGYTEIPLDTIKPALDLLRA